MRTPVWTRRLYQSTSESQQRRPRRPRPLVLEILEARELLSGAQPDYLRFFGGSGASPFGSPGPTGYSPSQIRHAYGFDQINFGSVPGDGRGTTIAIVDAFDDPNIANDLHQFDVQFGLPDPTFTKVNQSGGSTMPAANGGWATEIALDVEWAHAIAPGAGILLVEANDNSYSNLFSAVNYAAHQSGVVAVSMSWGGGEFGSETFFDSTFQTPNGHPGVTFIASSGDNGAPPSYPAVSPNVLSVGGTTLFLTGSNTISSESGWSGSGGGISSTESQPSYQNGVVTQTSAMRANPDVAYDSDPMTGFPVYDSYNNGTAAPWSQYGGTSVAAPQWAALIAIADQGRIAVGLSSLDGPSQTLPRLYALPASDFNDITSGGSSGSPSYSAGPGYDLVTGRGTPVANKIVGDLVGQTLPAPSATHFVVSAPSSTVAGSAFTFTVTAEDGNNNPVSGYTGTVHFTSTDPLAALPADYTFTSADSGTHNFSITLKTAGSQTVSLADTSNNSLAGSGTLTVNAAAASSLSFGQQPTTVTAGAVISPAVTVRVLDAYGNLVSSDNSDNVTMAIGSNPGGGTLSGSATATVSGGVATFNNLSISAAGVGYTLTANSGSLTGATSSSFTVSAAGSSGNLIEGFETASTWHVVNGSLTASRTTQAAHDGVYGLDMKNGSDWIYRNDASVQVRAGDTISVWLEFSNSANGRAYFGFGASATGTLSLLAAANSGQLILQQNLGYSFTDMAAAPASYLANHWYRLEVDWGTSGTIIGRLFDSNGTTLLQQVTAHTTVIASGGIAFRALGNEKFFDTVTDNPGVNGFAVGPSNPTGVSPTVLATAPTGPAQGFSGLQVVLGASSGKNLQDWLALWTTAIHNTNTIGATAITAAIEQSISPIVAVKSLVHGPTESVDLSDMTPGLIKL